ncbi:TlpA disulfide reductase family protein [Nocardioides terrisoli]|uniref:TlpA disulfide reductase family protein n=1 Tax=Nocardioides terrisoli TaxID=3388267 RepID=UPI00287BB537|nr:TlpA disulfide reductase family protein [Nocardioides marmorisolisilvae]
MRTRAGRLVGAVALAMAALLLAGCGGSGGGGLGGGLGSPQVKVDTPALRALKHRAHIQDCPATTAPPAAHGLSDVELPCLGGGRSVNPARLRGPMVVNLWAQSCAPCREEMPRLQAFAQKYAGKVAVLGVDWSDYRPELALQLARKAGTTYPLVADTVPHLRTGALPTTILVDAHGDIVFERAMIIRSVAQLEGLVQQHLGVS